MQNHCIFSLVSPARPSAAELKNTSKTKEDKLHHDEMRILRRPEGLAAGLNYARILGSVRKETEPGSTGRSLEVQWRRCVLCCAIWIRRVIMNIHGGVAICSDVAKLRDGNSCLRDVVGVFDVAMGSQRKQKDLKRKLQLIMDVQMAATEGIHTHVGAVKGTGGSEYVAKRLATDSDAKFASASTLQTESDLWKRLQHMHDTEKEKENSLRGNVMDTPVRARTTSSGTF